MTLAGAATVLQPELAEIKQALLDARERARRVAEQAGADRWGLRPSADRWSVAECLIHLNITSERFIPLLDRCVEGIHIEMSNAAAHFKLVI